MVTSANTLNYSPIDVEQGVIGAVLADPQLLLEVVAQLKPEYFQIRSMRMAWEAVIEMHSNGRAIDLMTLIEHLGPDGVASIGGQKVLVDAFDVVSTPDNIREYAAIIEDKWRGRELAKLFSKAQQILNRDGYEEGYACAQKGLIDLAANNESNGGFARFSDLVSNWFETVEEMQANPQLKDKNYLKTGYVDYDKSFGGLPNGMTILAGRPGQGKTSCAGNIAINVARQGKSVLFFSLEMSQAQVVTRLLSGITKIDSRRLEMGRIEEVEVPMAIKALEDSADLDLYLDESSTELGQIIAQIEQWRLRNERSPDLVVIDYLGLIKVAGVNPAQVKESATIVSRELSTYFTKRLQAPLLMLCQLNRGVEARDNKRPKMADLRDSGEIEQAAARIDMLYRDAYYNKDSEKGNIAELLTVKNRFGMVGTTELYFEPETTSFRNLAKTDQAY